MKITAINKNGIWIVFLSLTLLLSVIPAETARGNHERHTAATELVSRNFPQQRNICYLIFENNAPFHFFLSYQEIVIRLTHFGLEVKVTLAENLKSQLSFQVLISKILALTVTSFESAESSFIGE